MATKDFAIIFQFSPILVDFPWSKTLKYGFRNLKTQIRAELVAVIVDFTRHYSSITDSVMENKESDSSSSSSTEVEDLLDDGKNKHLITCARCSSKILSPNMGEFKEIEVSFTAVKCYVDYDCF